jgi:hypothetical protein
MMDMMGDGMDTMDHSAHGSMVMGGVNVRVHHASTEYGPSVDMRVDTPRTNLPICTALEGREIPGNPLGKLSFISPVT